MSRLYLASIFLLTAGLLGGCVTHAKHQALLEEATAAERERANGFEKRAAESERARAEAERELDAERDHTAELEFEIAQDQQALEASQALVDQLRNELGRVGGHLEHFGVRAKLATELEGRVAYLERRLLAVIQLANRLIDSHASAPTRMARIGLSKEGDLVIDVRTKALFYGKTSRLTHRGRALLTQLAPLAGDELGLSVAVTRAPNDDDPDGERADAVKELLLEAGAAKNSVSFVEPDPTSDDRTFRIRLGFGAETSKSPAAAEPPDVDGEATPNDA